MIQQKITHVEAAPIISNLVGKNFSGIIHRNDGNVTLLLGQKREITTLGCSNFTWHEVSSVLFEYEVQISPCCTVMEATNGFLLPFNFDMALTGKLISAHIAPLDNSLILSTAHRTIRVFPGSHHSKSWCILQPGSEEDILVLDGNLSILKRSSKRWTSDFTARMDSWHPFPLSCYEELPPTTSTSDIIHQIVGAKVIHGKKSLDMNFYNIGFRLDSNDESSPLAELHITCRFSVSQNSKATVTFWGDSDKYGFEQLFSEIISQTVTGVSLLENNSLHIELSMSRINVFPADDCRESWRLLFPLESKIIAADSWIACYRGQGDGLQGGQGDGSLS